MNQILHIGISVAGLDRTVAWYGNWFGFRETKRFEKAELEIRGAVIELGGLAIEVLAPFTPVLRAADTGLVPALRRCGVNHIAFGVDDAAATYTRFHSSGVTMVSELIGGRMFFCTDPDGTLLEIRGV